MKVRLKLLRNATATSKNTQKLMGNWLAAIHTHSPSHHMLIALPQARFFVAFYERRTCVLVVVAPFTRRGGRLSTPCTQHATKS